MALSTDQKIVIAVIGAGLLIHFYTSRKDPDEEERNEKDALNLDYAQIRQKFKDLSAKSTEYMDRVKADPLLFKKSDFVDLLDRWDRLKTKQRSEHIYARIAKCKGQGVSGWRNEDESDFEADINKHTNAIKDFIQSSRYGRRAEGGEQMAIADVDMLAGSQLVPSNHYMQSDHTMCGTPQSGV